MWGWEEGGEGRGEGEADTSIASAGESLKTNGIFTRSRHSIMTPMRGKFIHNHHPCIYIIIYEYHYAEPIIIP